MKTGKKHPCNMTFGGIALLFLVATFLPRAALAEDRALFQLGGMDYMESELPPELRLDLYEVEDEYYRRLQVIFDKAVFDSYLKEESERLGKSGEEIKVERLSVTQPSEESIRAFYEKIRNHIGKPYESVRERIAKHLRDEEMSNKRSGLVTEYRKKNNFKILLPRITSPVIEIHTQGFPAKGDPKAPVTIVEFADYQCPHCKTASDAIGRIFEQFKGKVRKIYIDYLVTRSPVSTLIAQGATCADQEGKFWPYHELAYQRQATLRKSSSVEIAKEVGLDPEDFIRCSQSEEAKAKVARANAEARRLGLQSTPTIFVNGKRLIIHDFEKDLRQAVERELSYIGNAESPQ
uniref:Thioredoxin n=1 Tax=Candidatus Kentrum sp. SD TaxID=2126332 RepID=A0A450YNK0_9GAMM|nr:MAG: Thioredoxin [Candidatus Kentron sp. SD]